MPLKLSGQILAIKAAIRHRDGYRCTECGMTQAEHLVLRGTDLEVHRIVPGSAYSLEPGCCVTLCRTCHGPKPRSPRGQGPRRDVVRIRSDLYLKARIIADVKGIKVAEYLGSLIRHLIEADHIVALELLRTRQTPPPAPD